MPSSELVKKPLKFIIISCILYLHFKYMRYGHVVILIFIYPFNAFSLHLGVQLTSTYHFISHFLFSSYFISSAYLNYDLHFTFSFHNVLFLCILFIFIFHLFLVSYVTYYALCSLFTYVLHISFNPCLWIQFLFPFLICIFTCSLVVPFHLPSPCMHAFTSLSTTYMC